MVSSLQRELNDFFGKVNKEGYDIQMVTKSALTHARRKLKPEAFLELNRTTVNEFYEGAPYTVWKGHRLLAVDGSTLNLPSHKSTKAEFGELGVGCNANVMRSMARISICYDVLNLLTVDAKIDGFNVSEQTLLKAHLADVPFKQGDILLLDRGYPSIALMYSLQQMGIHFCIRMKDSWWKEVNTFNKEGAEQKEVVFQLPSKDKYLQQQWQSTADSVRCRLVSIDLGNGEKEILCTSLLNEEVYQVADIKELYHYRWNIEEAYKLYKSRVGLEVFSGKTAQAIKQDFYARVFMMSVCAALSFPIEKKVREGCRPTRRHRLQINRTNAIAACRNGWVVIWIHKKCKKVLASLDNILKKTTDIVRPNRSFPRKKNPKKPPPMTYKKL